MTNQLSSGENPFIIRHGWVVAEIAPEWGHIPSSGDCHGCLRAGKNPIIEAHAGWLFLQNVKYGTIFILKMRYNERVRKGVHRLKGSLAVQSIILY